MEGRETAVTYGPVPGLVSSTEAGRKSVVRYMYQVPGTATSRTIFVHNNSLRNLTRGIVERVLYLVDDGGALVPCPRPDEQIVRARFLEFRRLLVRKLPPTTPLTLEEFPGAYWGRKRLVVQSAVDSLQLSPLTVRDARLNVFLKYEKLDGTIKVDPAPRIISPRGPRFNSVVGRWLKPSEHLLFRGIARVWGSRTVAKGLNALAVGNLIAKKFNRFKRPVALGLDAKRFDQHTSYEVIRYFEHQVYNDWFRDAEFARVIAWQLRNELRGYTPDGKLSASVLGRRMSGDMNTSSGNCLIMCGMVWAYCRDRGVRAELINNGDDCVLFFEADDLEIIRVGLHDWFLELGYNMVVEEPVYELEKVVFCQAQPIHVGELQYVMVRNPVVSLAKDSVALINCDHPESLRAWCSMVGEGGTAACGGVPVLDSFYTYFAKQGVPNPKWSKAYQSRGFDYLAANMKRRGLPVLEVTRYSFWLAFGILPGEQLVIEDYYNNLASLPPGIPIISHEQTPLLPPDLDRIISGF